MRKEQESASERIVLKQNSATKLFIFNYSLYNFDCIIIKFKLPFSVQLQRRIEFVKERESPRRVPLCESLRKLSFYWIINAFGYSRDSHENRNKEGKEQQAEVKRRNLLHHINNWLHFPVNDTFQRVLFPAMEVLPVLPVISTFSTFRSVLIAVESTQSGYSLVSYVNPSKANAIDSRFRDYFHGRKRKKKFSSHLIKNNTKIKELIVTVHACVLISIARLTL